MNTIYNSYKKDMFYFGLYNMYFLLITWSNCGESHEDPHSWASADLAEDDWTKQNSTVHYLDSDLCTKSSELEFLKSLWGLGTEEE